MIFLMNHTHHVESYGGCMLDLPLCSAVLYGSALLNKSSSYGAWYGSLSLVDRLAILIIYHRQFAYLGAWYGRAINSSILKPTHTTFAYNNSDSVWNCPL
jgi:hypothetical protein